MAPHMLQLSARWHHVYVGISCMGFISELELRHSDVLHFIIEKFRHLANGCTGWMSHVKRPSDVAVG